MGSILGKSRNNQQLDKENVQAVQFSNEPNITPGFLEKNEILKSHRIMSLLDPRSPNVEISRTPIIVDEEQGKKKISGILKEITKSNLVDSPNDSSDYETPKNRFSSINDPKSTAFDINRTPVGIPIAISSTKQNPTSAVRLFPEDRRSN